MRNLTLSLLAFVCVTCEPAFGQDVAPPQIVSAASLDGSSVGVCFNEALDPATANDPSHYTLSGGAVVTSATLQADGTTVALAVSGVTGNSFTVTVGGVKDLAGNTANSSAAGQVLGLTAQDLGNVEAPGIATSCAPGSADVWARGLDIWGFADSGHFVFEPRTGDFDVRVQVQSFQAPAPDANAGLMVRESAEAGSRNVSIVVYANQRNWTSTQRVQTDGTSTVLPGNWRINWPAAANYPNIWLRLKRAANTFTTYGGTNGVDWTQIGDSVTPPTPYPDTVSLGLRTTPVEVEVAGSTAFAQYRNYGNFVITNATITIVQQPTNTTVLENASATFSVVAEVVGSSSSNLSYQWQRDGLDIPGATAASYTTPPVTQADSGKKYRVRISLPGGTTTLSQEATLTVSQDVTPPQIVSAASLDGSSVGVCFNEALDPATANDPSHYTLSGGAVVTSATLQADGTTVALAVSGLTGNGFTVAVGGVKDLAGNTANSSAVGQVLGLTAQDLGNVEAPGIAISCAPGSADVWARGLDIWGFADSGHFVFESRTGDFDVRVQVQSFQAPAPDANAGLMVRESPDAGSRNVSIVVYANQRNWTSTQRVQTDGTSTVLPGNWRINWPAPANYPNIWLRLKRAANTFTTFGGTNGVDWIQIGDAVTPATPYPDTLLLGLRTTPVEVEVAGSTAFAQYRNYGNFVITNATITIVQQPTNTTVLENASATFSVVAEVVGGSSDNLSYQWQRDGLDVPGATAASYTTPPVTQADSGKKYRVKISLPGGTTTLSEEATLTVSQDATPPQIVSAASLDGSSVGVCFNEALDAATANDPSHYTLSGGAVVTSATLQADGTTVALAVSGLTGNSFTVTVGGVKDLAGNTANSSAVGQVLGLTAQDLGNVEAPGIATSCAPGSADVWARGLDIWGFADSGHFIFEQRTGDFDVRVQVQSFQAPAPDANAGLMVRESPEAGSRNVSIVVYANQRNWTSTQRVQTDGTSTVLPGNWRIDWPTAANYPTIWVRLKRAANTFTTYGGTNGVDWTQIGDSVTPPTPYSEAVLLGLRTTPVEVEVAGSTAFAQYRNYGDFVEILAPRLAVALAGVNQIAFSWPVNGTQDFVLESINVLGPGNWWQVTNAPTIQGNVKTVTLPVEISGARFLRLRR